jgi:caffeoyl-CoA O-methyltransferase
MSTYQSMMPEAVFKYYNSIGYREPAILAEIRAAPAALPRAEMQLAADEGQLLQILVQIMGAKRIVEVGVCTGYSSTAMALVLPSDGRIVACDVNAETAAIARKFWEKAGVARKIELHLEPGVRVLDDLIAQGGAGSYDLAFIDADKPNYLNYYERCVELARPGGLIAIDNTLWKGKPADPADTTAETEAIRAVNARVHADTRVQIVMVPIGDGLTLALKK